MRKKQIIMPRIYKPTVFDPKKWHVEFSVMDDITEKMQRFRKTKGFSQCVTEKQCWANARKLKTEYSKKLLSGWTPFDDDQTVIWEDSLTYFDIHKHRKPLYRTKKTVAYYSVRFLKTKENTAPGSYKTYMSKLRSLRTWLNNHKLGESDVSNITIAHGSIFLEDLNNPIKKASKTKNEYLRLFSEFWDYIRKDRKGIINIWEDFPRYKNDTIPQRPFKKGVLRLLKVELEVRKPQLWLAAQFQYYCFIRPGELRQMQIRHLDLYEGNIVLYSGMTKGSKSRVVDVSEDFIEILFSKYKLHTYPDDFYIFTKLEEPGLKPVAKDYFNRNFLKIRRAIGLPEDHKFYAFKHTGAVVANKSGANIKDIQHQMGHSNIQITDEYLKSMVGYESEFFRKKMPKI